MRNITITYSLLGIIAVLFIFYFIALHTVYPSGQPVVDLLNNIISYAQQENWTEAESSADELTKAWEKGKYLIYLNYAETDYSMFLENLSRIRGAIETRDNTETVCQALSTLELWNNFLKVIPLP